MNIRGIAWGVLVAVLLGVVPARSEDADPTVFLADPELVSGAVPELRFVRWPVDRWAAIYARTANGSVVGLSLKQRGSTNEAGRVLRISQGAERRVRVGGTSGYFVSPRTGAASDREALIVLLAAGRPPEFGSLAPIAGIQLPGDAPSAGTFFHQLATAPWLGDVEIHMVPYRIRAGKGAAVSAAERESSDVQLVFSGVPFDKVLTVADILAVETVDPPSPLRIRRRDERGPVSFGYRTALDLTVLAGRLEKIAADLGERVSVSVDLANRRLELSAP
ncbi:hypothetical protein [Nisaea sediminum]|uniref:hypothetical protein n=1 Tax=Nisaea sediminum TaxID=2775867 RepID=UPI00186803AD|nr:hypothetical protein [Nisaea sediminum]